MLPVVDEFLCARCARHMKTCCQTSEIYVTQGDVRRIEEHSGQQGFHEYRAPSDPIYLEQDDDPLWRDHVIRADGTRRVLKRQANGDCHFLGERGCRLPLETRPLICRIYPFDYNADGIRDELARGCPTELLPANTTLLTALDMRIEDATRWHAQLYQEIQQDPPCRSA